MQKKEKDARNAGLIASYSTTQVNQLETIESGGDSEDSGDESEEETEGGAGGATKKSRRKDGKLTRAQRNKIRARKQKEFEESQQKSSKNLLHEIAGTERYIEQIVQEEQLRETRKKLRELKKAEKTPEEALTYSEANAVPLSDELRGSMRLITPKGANVSDRIVEMRKTGDLNSKDRKRRHYEKPHGAKKVVWIPKYKY